MSLYTHIKQQLPILDVIGQFVQLRPAGNYWKGPCIFHAEKTASFTVSPDKQIFYCFGCHETGDVIGFIAKLESMTQPEAARYLIERFGITVPTELLNNSRAPTPEEKDAKERYFKLCGVVAGWCHQQLFAYQPALTYVEQRGISTTTIKQFMLGYFPGGSTGNQSLLKVLQAHGFMLKDLFDAGISLEGRKYPYSPFEERIVFPIKDNAGKFCGFGGRIFKAGDDRAKYYNSKESPGFEKGKILFGFDLAKKAIHDAGALFLVEGNVDCIMMAQYGFTNTVATLGTACTIDHLKLLARQAQQLYLLYDGDNAGQKAMLRLAEMCWEVNLDVRVIVLPTGQDPASFLTSGGDLNQLITHAADIMEHFVTSMGGNFQSKPLAQKMAAAEKIAGAIAKLSNQFKQDLMLHHAAATMGVPYEALKQLLQKAQRANKNNLLLEKSSDPEAIPEQPRLHDPDEATILEEKIFSGILGGIAIGKVVDLPHDIIPYFSVPMQERLALVTHWATQHKLTLAGNDDGTEKSIALGTLFDQFPTGDRSWAMRVAMQHNDQTCFQLLDRLLDRFCKFHWQKIVKDIKDEIIKAKLDNDMQRVNTVLERFAQLKQGMIYRGMVR